MKVIVLGGDGFCGWPTSLHLSDKGHDIMILDNFARRKADEEMGTNSLTPIRSMEERISAWKEVSGKQIDFEEIDIAKEYDRLVGIFTDYKPDAVIHFAEQRAAPYSMKSSWHKRYTVDNNMNATNNVLCAILDSGQHDIHLIHLGTTGVYGYGCEGFEIPEGYLTVTIQEGDKSVDQEIVHPYKPGSVYHSTKCMDNVLFNFYAKNDEMKVTDLHQGIVWGTNTEQTMRDERLINRFDYDGDYGTVLNRFLMQAAVGYPLTVHGTGGQTRAFIHIQNTVQCIELALLNPPKRGDRVKIFNQLTECHRVNDLANLISELTDVDIQYVENPRKEADENELRISNKCFLDVGLKPVTLREGLLMEVVDVAKKYKDRCNESTILCKSNWAASQTVESK
ncbi:MAG: NAD-dependent epimerase/dehydratase family protein [Spirochaetia bacterium]